jgi:pimeloyl-ACP methyl ester carboxylesterase
LHTGLILQAADRLRSGDRISARQLLEEALRLDPGDEQAWLWMSGAVDTDAERLACLRQVLVFDPQNQAALDGIKALSNASLKRQLDPAEASLETFLSEQEALLSLSPNPVVKKVVQQEEPVGKKTDLRSLHSKPELPEREKPSGYSFNELRNSSEARGMDWGKAGLSPAIPLTREHSFGLPGFLKEVSNTSMRQAKSLKNDLLPIKHIPVTSTQVTYFILGIIITFLLMLIGFSVLKTLVEGPRYKAGPAAAPPPLPSATPIQEPTPIVFKPTFVPSDCRFRMPPGAQVECFMMILPESRDGSSSRSIRIPLVIYRSLNPSPPPDPIFYLHPEGSAIEWAAENFDNFLLPLLYQRDVIVVEPRGNGQATPNLDCTELNSQYLIDMKLEPQEAGRTGEIISAVKACRDRLASQGIRFSNFTTAAFAADIADIAVLLNFEQINLYGVSNGGRVAQILMQEHPNLVRSAVLDSALPLEIKAYNSIASSAGYAFEQLFEACAANNACRSGYPNLEAVFNEVKIKLDETPVQVPSTSTGSTTGIKMTIDGTRFQQAILQALYWNDLIPEIPKGIYSARYGDTAFLEAALTSRRIPLFDPSTGGMLSYSCPEQVYATSPSELEADLEAYPDRLAFARYSIFGSARSLFEICELWNPAPLEVESKAPLHTSIPTLIINGQLDPVVPAYLGEQLSSHLNRASHVVFPALGHAPSTARNQECPLSLAAVFLYDPFSEFDPACNGELHIEFTGR